MTVPVFIVGAGPTGLVLALCLERLGIPFRIIDKTLEPGTTSRALVLHARTLEFYRQLGIADAVIDAAQKFAAVNLWVRGKARARLQFGDMGATLSKYPYSLIFPQDQHERVLIDALQERGIRIERGMELTDIAFYDTSALCTMRTADGNTGHCEALYVAGCDGAHSIVRAKMNIGFPGGTYSHTWYVADVDMTGPLTNGEVHISMDRRDVLAIFPMKEPGTARLIGQSPLEWNGQQIAWEDVNVRLVRELQSDVGNVRWFSTYRVHHRVADTFRGQRAFLVGDAAHVHSPVGGQGMNTGIGDAVNLAWKLASVLRHESSDSLLDTYASERMTFARGLVKTTDAVFGMLNSRGFTAGIVRTAVIPTVLPALMRSSAARRIAFRILSQTAIHYRNSRLSEGRAGAIYAGDRLPWVTVKDSNDNFEPLNGMRRQVHVYGDVTVAVCALCNTREIPLYVFPWQRDMRRAGLVKNALYLVRPDGHIAFADARGSADSLKNYLDRPERRDRQPQAGAAH